MKKAALMSLVVAALSLGALVGCEEKKPAPTPAPAGGGKAPANPAPSTPPAGGAKPTGG
jgi:hypothetical protein